MHAAIGADDNIEDYGALILGFAGLIGVIGIGNVDSNRGAHAISDPKSAAAEVSALTRSQTMTIPGANAAARTRTNAATDSRSARSCCQLGKLIAYLNRFFEIKLGNHLRLDHNFRLLLHKNNRRGNRNFHGCLGRSASGRLQLAGFTTTTATTGISANMHGHVGGNVNGVEFGLRLDDGMTNRDKEPKEESYGNNMGQERKNEVFRPRLISSIPRAKEGGHYHFPVLGGFLGELDDLRLILGLLGIGASCLSRVHIIFRIERRHGRTPI